MRYVQRDYQNYMHRTLIGPTKLFWKQNPFKSCSYVNFHRRFYNNNKADVQRSLDCINLNT